MSEHTASSVELTGVCQRLASHYTALAQKESIRGAVGYDRLSIERPQYLHLMKTCLQLGLLTEVCTLMRAIDTYLDRGGYWDERITALEMNLAAARQANDHKDIWWCLNTLGYIYERRGDLKKALDYYKQSLTEEASPYRIPETARVIWSIGHIYFEQDDFINAETYMENAVQLMEVIVHPELEFYRQKLEQLRAARGLDGKA